MNKLLLGGVIAVLLSGCGQKDAPASDGKTSGGSTTAVVEPPKEVAKDLMTEGGEYYLAKFDEPVKFKMTVDGKDPKVGNFIYKLKDGAKGQVEVERDGGLAELGTDKIELRKEGVFGISNSAIEFGKPQMELPADPTAGKTWESDIDVKLQGSPFKMATKYKVIGTEKLKTEAGEFDTLVVEATSLLTSETVRNEIKAKSWYAKGKGMIRQEATVKQPGKTTKQVYELTK